MPEWSLGSRELLALTGDLRVDVHAREEQAFQWACQRCRIDVVCELLALSGDRIICPPCELPAAGLWMLARGLGDPNSPAVAATWQAISSPGGMMCNAKADPKAWEAAAAGYRVYNWGRRGALVLCWHVAMHLRREGGSSSSSKRCRCGDSSARTSMTG